MNSLVQCGPTSFDLRAILQNLRDSSKKMMCETTDSQALKLKMEGECVTEIITQQQIAIYYKSLSVECLW